MEVKRGYKQTEVGIVPEEWEIKSLYMLADKIMVGIASAATHAYRNRGVVMFRNQNIKRGFLDDSDVLFIAEEYEETYRNKRLKSGDLLTARTGYPGTTCIVPEHYEGAQSFTTLITRPRRDSVHPAYLCSFINSEAGQRYFDQNQIGGGQKNVNAGSLKFLPIPLPPTLAEQEAIATALSDADAWIESLEQLIAKKRQIKQGAMQELLTGKRRLPGFEVKRGYKQTEVGVIPEDWQLKRLRDISPSQSVGLVINPSTYFDEKGTIPILVGSQIKENRILWESAKRITVESNNRLPASRLSAGDLVMVRVGDPGVVSVVPHHLDGCNCASMMIVRQHKSFNSLWLCYVMNSRGGRQQVEDVQYGTAQKQFNISDAINFQYAVPTLAEQEAIATTLSDMDTEIAMLETKLAKARQIKQGMMQELLTGRIRLI